MMIQNAAKWLKDEISPLYGDAEATGITAMILEQITGIPEAAQKLNKEKALNEQQRHQLAAINQRLQQHEPVQYILNKAWFYDFPLYVDHNVLIPRPETAELADWVIKDVRSSGKAVLQKATANADRTDELKILDIGTGSGCIALALKKKLPLAEVWGCDSSEEALNVARRNASELDIRVDFAGLDFLDEAQQRQLPTVDIIVSNPPYIPAKEKEAMALNVVLHEPHGALFVPDKDPLLFYRAIARFGHKRLYAGGAVYLEIHEGLGNDVIQLFSREGYDTTLKKDMQGKERMIKAARQHT